MMALLTMWTMNPTTEEEEPTIWPTIGNIPIIPIMTPNTTPPASPP